MQGLIQAARPTARRRHRTGADRAIEPSGAGLRRKRHRVDLFAVYAACASAALSLRDHIEDEDMETAARLVIFPRATQIPEPPEEAPPPPDQPPPPPPPPSSENEDESDDDDPPSQTPPSLPEEQIFAALMTELPQDLEDLPSRACAVDAPARAAPPKARAGVTFAASPVIRRHRLDTLATLRAAAPWQQVRSRNAPPAVLERKLIFHPDDLRVKQYRSKAGALFCFVVDASGSMALHRMRQAKGAVHSLLEKAYVNRDRAVADLLRGGEAEILMPPTQSVELAQRALDLLPTGGGTPLASALLMGESVAAQARARGILQTVLVLLTDGRANVPLHEGSDVRAELQQIGRHIAESSLRVIVVDTQRSYLSRGEARQLASWLGGEYAYLPGADGEQIANLAAGAVDNL
ncbi:MAG: VWA domain-containing protein [Caldilineaceae bacterium]